MRGLAYSPDSCLLAVAQSDAAVFVYRLGTTWGEPKAICNRFAAVALAMCLVWPASHAAGPVFGCADGQVGLEDMELTEGRCRLASHIPPASVKMAPSLGRRIVVQIYQHSPSHCISAPKSLACSEQTTVHHP